MNELKPIFLLAPFLWLALVIGASIYYRKRKGITFPSFKNGEYEFLEKRASGASNKNQNLRLRLGRGKPRPFGGR